MIISIIGQAIRQLREEKGLTIPEVARAVGISDERLSRIESNQSLPSFGILIKLSRVLGPNGKSITPSADTKKVIVTRSGEALQQLQQLPPQNRNLCVFQLAEGNPARHLEPLFVEVPPGSAPVSLESEYEGEEFIYVTHGEVKFYHGEQVFTLGQGDSIYYHSSTPHFLGNETDQPARVIAVIYTPY